MNWRCEQCKHANYRAVWNRADQQTTPWREIDFLGDSWFASERANWHETTYFTLRKLRLIRLYLGNQANLRKHTFGRDEFSFESLLIASFPLLLIRYFYSFSRWADACLSKYRTKSSSHRSSLPIEADISFEGYWSISAPDRFSDPVYLYEITPIVLSHIRISRRGIRALGR